jgi:hypothetical protein
MTDGVAHPPDLTVPTLVNRQSDHPRSEKRCFSRSSESILEFDPLPKPPEFGPSGRAFEVRDVFLLDAIGRMGQSMREGAIVGEEKKSFCIHVEATHREDAWFDGYQFDDRGATLRIVSRCNDPSRLVQQVVHESGFDTDRHAVDFDLIGQVDAETFKVRRLSFYAELIWEARKKRAKATITERRKEMDWVVVRNRTGYTEARNQKRIDQALIELSKRVGFRIASGLSERVIYRELFPSGLTLLDKGHLGELGTSHLVARQELRTLVAGLALHIPERGQIAMESVL